MTQKRVSIIGILIVAAASFAAGYWPEHRRLVNTSDDLRFANKQLTAALCRERIYRLENILLLALDRAAHKEFNDARDLTTSFFLEVQTDMARPDMSQFATALKEIADKGDPIRGALEREDPSARDMMREVMQRLAQMAGPAPTASDPPAVISVTQPPAN